MNEYEVVVTTTTLVYVHADTVDDAVEAAANMYLQMDPDNVEYDILSVREEK